MPWGDSGRPYDISDLQRGRGRRRQTLGDGSRSNRAITEILDKTVQDMVVYFCTDNGIIVYH